MPSLTEHILKLTDHRDRELLELTLSKALIDLVRVQRVVVATVVRHEGHKHWLDNVRMDARGGGKVADRTRLDISLLPRLDLLPDRLACLQNEQMMEVAWAGDSGPRITYLPLFANAKRDEQGVIEIHSASSLAPDDLLLVEQIRHVYRNMHGLLAYSDRDALTGLLNRKSLEDAFYSAVLEELDGVSGRRIQAYTADLPGQERRHRVPACYWLGTAWVDQFENLSDKHGRVIAEEVLVVVARLLNSTFRTYDLIYRFDGEHFGVLMHCPEEAVVHSVFERFRASVEKFHFPRVGHVTASCGFTLVMADDTPESALQKTRRAIDVTQKSGPNQVCSYLELVRKGVLSELPASDAGSPEQKPMSM